MIEVRGHRRNVFGAAACAFVLLLAAGSALADRDRNWEQVALAAGIPGVALAAYAIWRLIRPLPELRGTKDGISVRGRATIPWREIDTLFELISPRDASWYARGRVQPTICVPFFRRRTVLRLPLSMWLGGFERQGVDIVISGIPARVIADLEMLRGIAPDAWPPERRAPDAAALPAAQLQHRR